MKNFLSLLLCFSLIFGMVTMQVTASATEESAAVAKPRGLIYALGIVSAESELTAEVSRGEFAALVAAFMHYEASAGEAVQLFQDVSTSDVNVKAINMMYNLGYMSGDGDGYFRPNDAVTYAEVLTVLVKALGYGNMLQEPVQYPFSYLEQANRLDFALNKTDDAITSGEVYLILERALEAPFHQMIGVSGKGNILDDRQSTVLKELYHVYRSIGVVTQNDQTSLYDADGGSGRKEQISIDDELYWTRDVSVSEHLGEEIEFYYESENGINTLVFYTISENSKVIVIEADMLEGYSGGVLSYGVENGRIRQVKISDRANVLYNGIYDKKGYALTAADFSVSAGAVKLVANNSAEYTTVAISDYRFGIFDRLSSDDKISVKESTDSYPLQDYDTVTLMKDGTEITASELAEWDVLNILEDKQKQHLVIYVTRKTVEGTLEQLLTKDDGQKMTINGVVYGVNGMFTQFNTREPKLGRSDAFLLDLFGEVIALQDTSSGVGKYGVVLGIGTPSTFGGSLPIKFLNSKNRIKVYDITAKTLVNGEKYADGSKFSWLTDNREELKGKPLRFETNGSDELTELSIEFAGGYENVLDKKLDNARKRYKSGQQFFGNAEVAIRDNTSIFVVSDRITEDEDCSCVSRSYLGNDVYYTISSYNYDDYNIADLIVIHEDNSVGGDAKVTPDSSVFVSEGLITALDEDGGTIYMLTGMYEGERSDDEYWFSEADAKFSPEACKSGNIFQMKTSSKGEVLAVSVLQSYDSENLTFYYDSSSILGKVFGRVTRATSDKFMLNVSNTAEEDLRILMPKGNIYVYDTEEGEARLGSAGDIAAGSVVFIRDRYQDPKDMVIFLD